MRTLPDPRLAARRARRRLALAGLVAGAAAGGLLGGLLVHPLLGSAGAPSVALAASREGRAALLALLALGLLARGTLPRGQRLLAGCGWTLGAALAGAGLAVLADAAWLRAWDAGLFGAGLALVGAWLAAGAAPPADLARPAGVPPAARAPGAAKAPRRGGRRVP